VLKVLDLFSGIGGFSLGLERTGGFETVAFCEIDPFCQKVLREHWPRMPIYDDVRSLDYDGSVDLICGGYPCQPFSFAGKRQGAEDDRHLWPAMFELIKKHRPSWVIGENVAGHIDMGLDNVLSDLGGENYQCRAFVIPACAVSAPHRRDRVWIIAHTKGAGNKELECSHTGAYPKGKMRAGRSDLPASTHSPHAPNNRSKRGEGLFEKTISWKSAFSWCENIRGPKDYFGRSDIPEPLVCRNNDGVSQRLHALGNAVVPQIPEIIGYAILEAEKQNKPAGG